MLRHSLQSWWVFSYVNSVMVMWHCQNVKVIWHCCLADEVSEWRQSSVANDQSCGFKWRQHVTCHGGYVSSSLYAYKFSSQFIGCSCFQASKLTMLEELHAKTVDALRNLLHEAVRLHLSITHHLLLRWYIAVPQKFGDSNEMVMGFRIFYF